MLFEEKGAPSSDPIIFLQLNTDLLSRDTLLRNLQLYLPCSPEKEMALLRGITHSSRLAV